MSSSTTLTFIFPEMTNLEVTVGNGVVPKYLGIPANNHRCYNGPEVLDATSHPEIAGKMTRFDQALLNLLVERHLACEEVRRQECANTGETFYANAGLHLKVEHHR